MSETRPVIYGRRDNDVGIRLRFPYHPRLLDIVRGLRVRRYDKTTREWVIPFTLDAVDELYRSAAGSPVILQPEIVTAIESQRLSREIAAQAKEEGDADLGGFTFITEPWPHQRAAVRAGAHMDGYALFWEMGTGKTKAAIDIARWRMANRGLQHVLVIAPNEVIYNWKREVAIHARQEAIVLEGSLVERGRKVREGVLPMFTIVNIESIAGLLPDLRSKRWGLVIVDESTRIKNPTAQRTKAATELGKNADARLILSGTPVVQHLYDLYAQLEFLAPGVFGRYQSFKWRYFEMRYDHMRRRDILVPRHDRMPELLRIVDSMSYRVTKAEVLPDLPEKLPPQFLDVPMRDAQLRAYQRMRMVYRTWLMAQEGTVEVRAALVVTQKLRLAQIAAGFMTHPETGEVTFFPDHAKGKVVDDLVEDLMPGKVVIFCHFRAECEHYFQRYERYGAGLVYGGMQPRDRDAIVAAFQESDSPRVLVCQEGSGGIGINLTRASTAIYTSRSFSLEQWLQSQDRLHRAGQKSPVTLVIVQGRGTVDLEVNEVLEGKVTIADLVTRDRER